MFSSTDKEMSPQERSRASILLVEQDRIERQNLKSLIGNLGYSKLIDTAKHSLAIQRLGEPDNFFSHVIFDARPTDMNPTDFLREVLDIQPNLICIACSVNPNLDDVFQLLVSGARGFMLKPFTLDAIDTSIIVATKSEPLAPAVREAQDRNEALATIVLSAVDKAAELHKQARILPAAEKELGKAHQQMAEAMELARMFAKGEDLGLASSIEQYCIEKSKGPSTKLGMLRKRLRERSGSNEEEDDAESREEEHL
jgi:DNA-binding NarL/FixJ family response regulator